MFSENGKISEKQLRRMVVLPVFVSIILVIPYVSAKLFGGSILPGLLLFLVLAGFYVLYIHGVGVWYENRKVTSVEGGFLYVLTKSGLVGKFLGVVQVVRLVLRLSFYILLTMSVLFETQVPFIPEKRSDVYGNLLVVLPLLLVALYGANPKVEKQGRIHEMLFWLIFLPFIAVVLFGFQEVDYVVFLPKVDMPLGRMLLYAYMLLVFVLPVENYLYLRPNLAEHNKRDRTCIAVVGVVALGVLLTVFILGIYGTNGAADNPMTTISIMRYIRLPFGILERFDVLMLGFFVIGVYLLISETLYFAKHIIDVFWNKKTSLWILLLPLLLALFVVVYVRTYENGLLTYICYGAILDVPLSFALPLLGIGIHSWKEE